MKLTTFLTGTVLLLTMTTAAPALANRSGEAYGLCKQHAQRYQMRLQRCRMHVCCVSLMC